MPGTGLDTGQTKKELPSLISNCARDVGLGMAFFFFLKMSCNVTIMFSNEVLKIKTPTFKKDVGKAAICIY